MKKALLGLANNIEKNKEKINLWSKSFRKVSNADIVLIAANTTDEDIEVCEELNIKYESVIIEDTEYINHKRLEHTKNYLQKKEHGLYIVTDVFDVIFQSDPFSRLDVETYDIFVSGEGVNVNQEPWNYDNIKKIFPQEIEKCSDKEVICSGIIAGKVDSLIQLYEKMYYLCEIGTNDHNIKDQAALNVIIANNFIDKIKIFNLDDAWAMHCAVSGPTDFFISWGFKNSIKYGIPKMIDGIVFTGDDKPYDMVHQYNRVPDWEEAIKNKILK